MPTRFFACSLLLLVPGAAFAEGDPLCESLGKLFGADQTYGQYAYLGDDQIEALKGAMGLSSCTQFPRVSLSCSAEDGTTNDYSVAKAWTGALQEKADALTARLEACPGFEGWRPQEAENSGSATYPLMTKRWLNHGRDLQITLTHGFVRHAKTKRSAFYNRVYTIRFDAIEP